MILLANVGPTIKDGCVYEEYRLGGREKELYFDAFVNDLLDLDLLFPLLFSYYSRRESTAVLMRLRP